MSDMAKIIKGLEEISDYFFSVYHHSKDREEINKAKDRCDTVEDALVLLKEQEAQIERLEHGLAVTQNNLNYYVNGNCGGEAGCRWSVNDIPQTGNESPQTKRRR